MSTTSEKNTTITIVFTIIISSLILASFTYLFYVYLIPFYQIDIDEIYSILIRLLPLVIGLLLTIISIIVAPLYIPHTSSKDDELPIEEITAPLYNLPDEGKEMLSLSTSEKVEPSAIQSRIINSKLSPVAPPVVAPLETTYIHSDMSEGSSSVVDSSPFIITTEEKETLQETIVTTSSLERAVDFSQYPFEITQDTIIASLLSNIEATTPVDLNMYPELAISINDSLDERLIDELHSALKESYPLSFSQISIEVDNDETLLDEVIVSFESKLNLLGIVYSMENRISVILPFYNYKRCQLTLATSIKQIKKKYPTITVYTGFTSLNERSVDIEQLKHESQTALDLAREQVRDSIIGFESDNVNL